MSSVNSEHALETIDSAKDSIEMESTQEQRQADETDGEGGEFNDEDDEGLLDQFERLESEYEALAAKKRKASSGPDDPHETAIKKLRVEYPIANFEDLVEEMFYGRRRKSRKTKRRGRPKGLKNKVSPEVTRKLGDATLHYAHGRYQEAKSILKEVILISPYLPDPYHMLGLIYDDTGDKDAAIPFYLLATRFKPKDASLWRKLVSLSMEQGIDGKALYCISKAINADPDAKDLRYLGASLYIKIEEYYKAAELYEQIARLEPQNIEALKTATMLYQKCGRHERSISAVERFLNENPEVNIEVTLLLVSVLMEGNSYIKALQQIESAEQCCLDGSELPVDLTIKSGICHAHLGHIEKAQAIFSVLQRENVCDCSHLILEVADALAELGLYTDALKYYLMLDTYDGDKKGLQCLNTARCYLSLNARVQAIEYFYQALKRLEDNIMIIDARLDLASLLLEEDKCDEAVSVLSPPCDSESQFGQCTDKSKPWWLNSKIKLKLSHIYKTQGLLEDFVGVIYAPVRDSLFLVATQRKVKARKRLTRKTLLERAGKVDDGQNSSVFNLPILASKYERLKGQRAKKLLHKREKEREEIRTKALAAGVEWNSDDSDDEPPPAMRDKLMEPPIPKLLKDEELINLIIDLCKALASLKRHQEALQIINCCLKFGQRTLPVEKKEELRSLGAKTACFFEDPHTGWECARYIVNKNPKSISAWNCYYKIVSRLENRFSKHKKFVHRMQLTHKDTIPPILLSGNQLTMISQHQAAAKEYLEAYKLMPDNTLINLCAGTALINIALGHRLQNKHQCVLQGLAFLHNNLRLSEDNQNSFLQESLYNIARACHHVGLVSLAVTYYEKVLEIHEKDYPLPKLPIESPDFTNDLKSGYCDLRREAAYNLHLIYRASGALDLARQVLKDHCTF